MNCVDVNIKINYDKDTIGFMERSTGQVNEKNGIEVTFNEIQEKNCNVGHIEVHIDRDETWDTKGLACEEPVVVDIRFDDQPNMMTCMYLYSEWWTRPGFVDRTTDIPNKTQILFCKYDNYYSCVLPMVGDVYKTFISSSPSENRIRFIMDAGIAGVRDIDEVLYISSKAASINEAVGNIFRLLEDKWGIKLRENRKYPEMFKYIGWCSWDAFYKDISEELILEKAEEIKEKELPIRWMIFDDGWLQDENDMINALEPDEKKFPHGFNQLISDIKLNTAINWVGVWHAFGGYWAGINPKSRLASEKADCLYRTVNGRVVPSPFNGKNFYKAWYEMLKAGQVDFVKVDGQSAMPIYFKNDISYIKAAKGMSNQLEKGAEIFDKNIINCMGMAMENILSREETGISRNSDDFVPLRENGFVEHILQNAYNSLYHNEIYYCDWDMFWSTHKDAIQHGLIRAISGGPIYVSDKIGESDPDIISKLCYFDGRIPLLNRSAKPTDDVIFTDVTKRGLLKIQNVGDIYDGKLAGVVAAFNLTDSKQNATVRICDITEMADYKNCYVYDYFNDTVIELDAEGEIEVSLDKGQYAYFIFLSKEDCTPIGLMDKFVGFKAIKKHTGKTGDVHRFLLEEIGRFGFISKGNIKCVKLNDADVTEKLINKGTYYYLNLEQANEEGVVEILFS